MKAKTLIGALVTAGLVLAGCGGVEEMDGSAQEVLQTEQAALSCASGYTASYVWYCGPVSYSLCRTQFANQLHLECSNETGSYDAGVVSTQCGTECY
jgi:hypothetical protein